MLLSSVHRMVLQFSLGRLTCSLANSGTLQGGGLLADRLAPHRRLLVVTALSGIFSLSLITLEPIIGSVFATLGSSSIRSNGKSFVFFHPRLSGLAFHFRALEIISDEQPIIFCTLSNQRFDQSTPFFWTMSGTTRFSQVLREKCMQTVLASSFNKGHVIHTLILHRMNDLTDSTPHCYSFQLIN